MAGRRAGGGERAAPRLATVRSTTWALLAVVAFNVITAALLGALLPGHLSAHQKATIDSVRVSLGGLHLSQVAIGLLGVLAVTGEYGSGMIRATHNQEETSCQPPKPTSAPTTPPAT